MDLLETINSAWGWKGFTAVEILGRNPFGNVLFGDDTGRVWRITPEDLSCEIVAETTTQFSDLTEDREFQIDWDMAPLVAAAQEKHGTLQSGQVFCFAVPPGLGGSYAADNIQTAPLLEVISVSADLAQQIKDMPDGAQIRLKVVD